MAALYPPVTMGIAPWSLTKEIPKNDSEQNMLSYFIHSKRIIYFLHIGFYSLNTNIQKIPKKKHLKNYDSTVVSSSADIVRVFLENNKSLHDGCDGKVLLCGQLSSLAMRQEDGGGVGLEPSDGLGLAGLTDHVDGLADPHGDGQRPELLVKGDEHPG